MKDVDEEIIEHPKVDVEQVAFHLLKAYPTANYVALNTGLTANNQNEWKDHWYFIGFEDEPVYKLLDGWPAWVANDSIDYSDDEWGLFFLHISSKDHVFRGIPIQASPTEIASPRWFCWKLNPDGESLTQIIADEIVIEDKSHEFKKTFKDMMDSLMMKPLMEALKPRDYTK